MSDKPIYVSDIMRCLKGCADLLEAIEYNLGLTPPATSFQKQVTCLREAIALQEATILDGNDFAMLRDNEGVIKVGGAQKVVDLTEEQADNIHNFGLFGG